MAPRSIPTAAAIPDGATDSQRPVEPESLLALTLEQSAKSEAAARDKLAGLPRILHLAPGALAGEEEGSLRIEPATVAATVKPELPVTTRRASLDARSGAGSAGATLGSRTTTTSLATAGPCDRYNPFGESLCANAPAPGRAVPAPHSKPDRTLAVR